MDKDRCEDDERVQPPARDGKDVAVVDRDATTSVASHKG